MCLQLCPNDITPMSFQISNHKRNSYKSYQFSIPNPLLSEAKALRRVFSSYLTDGKEYRRNKVVRLRASPATKAEKGGERKKSRL